MAAAEQAKIRANTRVGTAALTAADIRKIGIEMTRHELEDLKFDVSATVSVTTDYTTERTIRLSKGDLVSPWSLKRRD